MDWVLRLKTKGAKEKIRKNVLWRICGHPTLCIEVQRDECKTENTLQCTSEKKSEKIGCNKQQNEACLILNPDMRSKGRLAPNPEQHIVVPLGAWANVKYARGPWRAHGGNKEGTWRAIVPHGAWVTSSNEVVKKALQPKLDNTCAVHSSKLSCSSWQRATDAPPLVILVINWNVTEKKRWGREMSWEQLQFVFSSCAFYISVSLVFNLNVKLVHL